jgi:hypothetical protein
MQVAVSVLLSMDLIPEGQFGYTAEENAQRLAGSVTIIEMSVFSLLLSYLFSHRSMNHLEAKSSDMSVAVNVRHSSGGGELAQAAASQHRLDMRSTATSNVQDSAVVGGGAVSTPTAKARASLFEQVMGDTKAVNDRRSGLEAVSLLAVRISHVSSGDMVMSPANQFVPAHCPTAAQLMPR